MKNVTKILGAVVLCTALFASAQRTDALGGNQFWPEDEANIAWFPAQVNNHAYVQLSGIGTTDVGTADEATDAGHASILFQKDGTTWGFNYGGADWINMHWGDGQQGVSFGLQNDETSAGVATSNYSIGYGNTFSFGELGVHYTGGDSYDDAVMDVHMKSDFGFWLFDDTYVGLSDLTGDMELSADFYSHMDAGGADVVYGWGVDYDTADDGGMTQTATLGVEANMTDWATLRAGYNWTHVLTNDADSGGTGNSTGTFAWGLGFNWGGLTADMTVNSSLLQDPIGTVTGFGDAITTDSITLTYSF